jgi:hypothetical protein
MSPCLRDRALEPEARLRLVSVFSELFAPDNERFRPDLFRVAASDKLFERDRLEARGYRDG